MAEVIVERQFPTKPKESLSTDLFFCRVGFSGKCSSHVEALVSGLTQKRESVE